MSTQTDKWIGQQLRGRNSTYRVRSLLGRGGMANVYLAVDRDGREVAVKIPLEGLLHEEGFVARFAREVRILMQFKHPHMLSVLDVSEDSQSPFVVMPYLAMGSLRLQQPCEGQQGKPFPMRPDELLNWLPDIAEALDYLHQQGYVHRDVKPENIMFDADGHAYLGDFGIIKVIADNRRHLPQTYATAAGMVLGTPHYMAPEVLIGDSYDGAADQYALACTAYELLAARVPFPGEMPMTIIGHTTKTPPNISEFVKGFPTAIDDVIRRGLAKQPSSRYPNCRALAQAFATAARDNPPPRPAKRPSSSDGHRPSTTAIVCPHCREQAQLPAGVKCRTLCCAKCRKVFSTTDNSNKKLANAPTRREEQAHVETRTDQRRPRPVKDKTARPFRPLVFVLVCGVLFAFWFIIGFVSLLLDAQTLGITAFLLTIPFLLAGMVLAALHVLGRSSQGAITQHLRTCEQALVDRRYDDALQEATHAIELDQRCARAYMQRGFAYAKLRQYPAALADLTTAIKLDSTLADAYAARAYVYRQQGDEARAKADDKKANERIRK